MPALDHSSPAGKILDFLAESKRKGQVQRLTELGIERVYLAGPMTGIPEYNFPAFRDAAAELRFYGLYVVSPVELDETDGFEPDPEGESLSAEDYAMFLARDIHVIAAQGVQAIVVLDGWENSGGAKTEVAFARALLLPVLRYQDLREVEEVELPEYNPATLRTAEEVRVVNEKTGGQKGSKQAQFSLLPWDQLWHVAEHYAAGAEKYDRDNWRKGYDWHLSADAMQRHFVEFWVNGEYIDPETNTPHLAAIVFHALALMYFHEKFPELDDRPLAYTAKED